MRATFEDQDSWRKVPITLIDPFSPRGRRAQSVALVMDETYLQCLGLGPADRSMTADVLLREEPEEEEEDEEEDDPDQDDDDGDEGYSE